MISVQIRFSEIPAGESVSVSLLTVLLPGPHALKNYLAFLGGVRLKPFLLIGVPIYTVRASSGILFGGVASHVTTNGILFLAAYWTFVAVICAIVVRRLRRKLRSIEATPEDMAVPLT